MTRYYVYFMIPEPTSVGIKIGRTSNFNARWESHRCSMLDPQIVGLIQCETKQELSNLEKQIKTHLSEFTYKERTEWFYHTEEVRAFYQEQTNVCIDSTLKREIDTERTNQRKEKKQAEREAQEQRKQAERDRRQQERKEKKKEYNREYYRKYNRERYQNDPEYRERVKRYNREYQRKEPHREYQRKYNRERYQNDPEYRERVKRYNRERYQKKRRVKNQEHDES